MWADLVLLLKAAKMFYCRINATLSVKLLRLRGRGDRCSYVGGAPIC